MDGQRRTLTQADNGDGRLYAVFAIMAVLTLMFAVLIIFSEAPNVGPEEGKLAPNLVGKSHQAGASGWGADFVLYDEINRDWVEGDGATSPWFVMQFIDTDCGHCWTEAEEMTNLHSQYGSYVTFVTVAISLGIPGWDSNAEEIVAFQEKGDYDGCNNGKNCNTRPGQSHDWTYVNDLDGSEKSEWKVSSTPFAVLLKPNGEVAWNMGQHDPQEGGLPTAMNNLFGGA